MSSETVLERVERRNAEYAALPIFEAFRRDVIPRERFRDFFPEQCLTARMFQDLIWAATDITDGPFAAFAKEHRRRDSSHFRWAERDLVEMGFPAIDVETVFAHERLGTRLQFARMLARAEEASDLEKIVILICMEATGNVTLPVLHAYAVRHGFEKKTVYLGEHHVNIEARQERQLRTEAEPLTSSRDPRLLETVDVIFDAFIKMVGRGGERIYGDLLARMAASP
ncbi:MAG: hypothetical protein U0270_36505 [Labilithrix sp.]